MKLYIVRHGSYNTETGDLNEEGRSDVQALRSLFDRLETQFDAIYASAKPRAQQTAEIIADGQLINTVDFLTPTSDADTVLKYLNEMSGSVVIVGHNPIMQNLAATLGYHVLFDTACCLHLDHGKLHWFSTPEILSKSHA